MRLALDPFDLCHDLGNFGSSSESPTPPNIPMRPVVSFCGSPTYQLSKHLTNVLKPLTDESRHKLQSTENFIDAIKTIEIPDDHKLVSFDV